MGSARAAALQCAYALERPYREGFVVNRYIGRTFIMPGQTIRRKGVRMKLNTIKAEFKDKRVLLVDDSIVRGTTSIELVKMAREAGAKDVYLVSAAPEVRYPNFYGIDIPTCSELIAHDRDTDEIAKKIGVTWLIYQDLLELQAAVSSMNSAIKDFESSVFSGTYVGKDVDQEKVRSLQGKGDSLVTPQRSRPRELGDSFRLPPVKRTKMAALTSESIKE